MTGFAALQVLLPKLVEQEWNGGVGSYGLLFTLQGVGMVFGSIVLRTDLADPTDEAC